MIVGIGIDVCSIDRMDRALERHGDRFFDRICSREERADRGQRHAGTFLAGRFAVKEAFAKALDGAPGVGWHEVMVRRTSTGRPVLELTGHALDAARGAGASRWHVTISHDGGVAAAVVVLEAESSENSSAMLGAPGSLPRARVP
jgi:holo-[acyl-carrier protein] synthase